MSFNDYLSIYAQLELLARADDEKFRLLCSSNKELRKICLGKQTSDEIAVEGNRTEFLYEARCRDKFTQDVIDLRRYEPGISWKEFYDRISIFMLYKHDYNLANYYAIKGYLIELTLIDLKQLNAPLPFIDILLNEDIHILEYLYSIGMQPESYTINSVFVYNKTKSIEWLKSKGIVENNIRLPIIGISGRKIDFYPHFKDDILELIESEKELIGEQIFKFNSSLLPPGYTFTRIINYPWYSNTLIIIPIEEVGSGEVIKTKRPPPRRNELSGFGGLPQFY